MISQTTVFLSAGSFSQPSGIFPVWRRRMPRASMAWHLRLTVLGSTLATRESAG